MVKTITCELCAQVILERGRLNVDFLWFLVGEFDKGPTACLRHFVIDGQEAAEMRNSVKRIVASVEVELRKGRFRGRMFTIKTMLCQASGGFLKLGFAAGGHRQT